MATSLENMYNSDDEFHDIEDEDFLFEDEQTELDSSVDDSPVSPSLSSDPTPTTTAKHEARMLFSKVNQKVSKRNNILMIW